MVGLEEQHSCPVLSAVFHDLGLDTARISQNSDRYVDILTIHLKGACGEESCDLPKAP